MVIRELEKSVCDSDPYQEWNAFIDLIAVEDYKNMNDLQRVAHLCFWYDSEVNNGGHLQYFENQGNKHLDETIEALKSIGATAQADILSNARLQLLSKKRNPITSVFSFVKKAREGEFDAFDNEFYNCEPSVNTYLEKYFKDNKDQFVKLI